MYIYNLLTIYKLLYILNFLISEFSLLWTHNSFLQEGWPTCLFPVAEPCLRLFNRLKMFKTVDIISTAILIIWNFIFVHRLLVAKEKEDGLFHFL